jgi:hypothetical protein
MGVVALAQRGKAYPSPLSASSSSRGSERIMTLSRPASTMPPSSHFESSRLTVKGHGIVQMAGDGAQDVGLDLGMPLGQLTDGFAGPLQQPDRLHGLRRDRIGAPFQDGHSGADLTGADEAHQHLLSVGRQLGQLQPARLEEEHDRGFLSLPEERLLAVEPPRDSLLQQGLLAFGGDAQEEDGFDGRDAFWHCGWYLSTKLLCIPT